MKERRKSCNLPVGFKPLGSPIQSLGLGERVDVFLSRRFPFLSRRGWQQRIESGELLLNGIPCKAASRLSAGDSLLMFHPPEHEPEVSGEVKVVFEDQGVLC